MDIALSLAFIFILLFLFFYYFGKGFWESVKIFLLVLLVIPFLPLIILLCILYPDNKKAKARKKHREKLLIEKMNITT